MSAPSATDALSHYRSKTLAAWLAVTTGTLGLHRFYVHGLTDRWGWLHPLPTGLGLIGLHRHLTLGQDDRLSWVLLPLLGLSISVAMLTAIVWALTPDERWDARHNPGHEGSATGWGPVLAAILAMLLGGGILMGTIAYAGQRFFEAQLQAGAEASEPLDPLAGRAGTPGFERAQPRV
jgi:hypothetical protein